LFTNQLIKQLTVVNDSKWNHDLVKHENSDADFATGRYKLNEKLTVLTDFKNNCFVLT